MKPEYSTNVEASYLFRKKYSISLGYTHISDVISQILLQNEEKKSIYQTYLNVASQDLISFTFSFPVKITSWWNTDNSIMSYYNQLSAPELQGADLNTKQISADFYSQNNFTLSKLFSADAAIIYNTPASTAAFMIKSRFRTDAGLRYNFPNKMGNLKLTITDVFHTQNNTLYSNSPANTYNLEQSTTSTSARITFTYRFGKATVKSERSRTTGLDTEQKRL